MSHISCDCRRFECRHPGRRDCRNRGRTFNIDDFDNAETLSNYDNPERPAMTKPTPVEIIMDATNATVLLSRYQATNLIRALEAAGYRIMGPEVTDEMSRAATIEVYGFGAGLLSSTASATLFRAMHAAAKKWGGE